MVDAPDRAEIKLSDLRSVASDRAEFSEMELNTLNRQLPKETSQGVFSENICHMIERGHDLYQVVDRGQLRPAGQLPDIVDCFEQERQI
ncbi:MAG TPA: hypothetical protein VGS02_16240 [Acidobacteriaceae bacterium]|nr:hypothetical protein [Acidobacteriaceae bacterium]